MTSIHLQRKTDKLENRFVLRIVVDEISSNDIYFSHCR